MKNRPFRWIISQIRGRIPAVILLTIIQMGHALFGVLFALGSRGVIDGAASGDRGAFARACLWQMVIVAGILVMLTASRHLKERLSADLERDWKRKLLHSLLAGEYEKVSSFHSGELINRLNNDVAKVNDGVLTILPSVAAMVTRLVGAVIVLGTMDIRFMLVIAALGACAVIITGVMRRHLKELNKRVSEYDGKVSGFLQEIIEKLLMVQAMDVSTEVERRADNLLEQRYELQRKRKNINVLANSGVSVMYYGAGFFALVWCAGRVLQGQMSFGSLTAVIQLVNQLQRPFVDMSGVLPQYAAMTASAERLMELDQIQSDPEPLCESAEELYQSMELLCAEGMIFAYDRERVLDNVSFALPKGAFVCVTGRSGIGKSTLLKLLLGVCKPESGSLFLEAAGKKVFLDRRTRHLFAYVPQGNLLLSGTLRENLIIARPQATEAEIRKAVYVSAMDEFLPQLPNGLDTVLGESGAGLSEGQAQRLAIARAVLSGAPILLLDECTSALDKTTERVVLRRLSELPDKMCFAVTHRPAALELCDWRLEADNGKLYAYKMRS